MESPDVHTIVENMIWVLGIPFALVSSLLTLAAFYLVVRADERVQCVHADPLLPRLGSGMSFPVALPFVLTWLSKFLIAGAIFAVLIAQKLFWDLPVPGFEAVFAVAWPWQLSAALLLLFLVAWGSLLVPSVQRRLMGKMHLDPVRPLHLLTLVLVFSNLVDGLLGGFVTAKPEAASAPEEAGLDFWSAHADGAVFQGIMIYNNAILYTLLAFLGVLAYAKRDRWPGVVARLRLQLSPLGLLLGAGVGAVLFFLYGTLQAKFPEVVSESLLLQGLAKQAWSAWTWVTLLVGYAIFLAAAELVFRGALQPRVGVIWASLAAFVPVHLLLGEGWLSVLAAILVSFASGLVAKRYGTWASVALYVAGVATLGVWGWFA